MADDRYSEKRVKAFVKVLTAAMDAHEAGARISDAMTFDEARLLNMARRFSETVQGKCRQTAMPSNLVEAAARFRREDK